jgi:hypothetical protein
LSSAEYALVDAWVEVAREHDPAANDANETRNAIIEMWIRTKNNAKLSQTILDVLVNNALSINAISNTLNTESYHAPVIRQNS